MILAFGMFADRLGFAIESVAAAFPDCIAKRRLGEERWQTVRIEFEYRSRSFRDHGHDPEGCDLIVCWAHDWADCPVPVIELKSALAGLSARQNEEQHHSSGDHNGRIILAPDRTEPLQ